MEITQWSREELLECIAEFAVGWLEEQRRRQDAEEKQRMTNEAVSYWYHRYTELEGNAHVQGMPVEPASTGVPGSAGGGAGAVPGMR